MGLTLREVTGRPLWDDTPFRWRMGLRTLPIAAWLQPDDARDADLAEKRRILAAHPDDAVAWDDASVPAAAEIHQLVASTLRPIGLHMATEGAHPIDTAGRSVQEDLCLVEWRAGAWRLTAGSVCFPTRWSIADKLGATLAEVHAPVPGYAAELGERVERFFDRLTPGSLAWRLNWSVVDRADRRLPAAARQAPPIAPPDPGRDLFLRVERQTLRRLERHHAVCFGIRIHVWPLEEVVDLLPARALATQLVTMPAAVARYKNLEGVAAGLAEWLRDHEGG